MSRSNSLRAYQHDTHSKFSESCSDSCSCSISFHKEKCRVDLDCALKVASQVQLAVIGCVKVYMIEIVLKNCTKEVLQFVSASLELDASSFLITSDCNSPASDCVQVIGLDALSEDCRDINITTDIDGGALPVNKLWNGSFGRSNLFARGGCGTGAATVQLPPGESRIKIRIIANVGDLYIVNPLLVVSGQARCCPAFRISQTLDTKDCMPSSLDLDTCPGACCPPLPQ